MSRVTNAEKQDIATLLENEAKHLKEADAPVHYMIYGHNAENCSQVSDNLSKVRDLSLRLASELSFDDGKGHLDDYYHPTNYVQIFQANENHSLNGGDFFSTNSVVSRRHSGARNYVNLYPDDIESKRKRQLNQVLPNNMAIISVRLLCSPPGYKAQDFHLDYGQEFKKVYTMFVAITPSTVGNCTEIIEWSDGNAAKQIYDIAQKKMTLRAGKDVTFASGIRHDQSKPCKMENDETFTTSTPTLVSLTLSEWDIALVKTSHHFHRRGDTSSSDYTRLTLNIDLVDASELGYNNTMMDCDDGANGFVCIDTLRALDEDRVCATNIIDNMMEQDITLSGMPF